MTYLLDVNALVALGFLQHEFHERVSTWMSLLASKGVPEIATCSITELGFVRILAQASQYGFTVALARSLLLRLKAARTLSFRFLPDTQEISQLPAWVKTPKQITDGHLLQLAKSNGAVFATLDRRIPSAVLIPQGRS